MPKSGFLLDSLVTLYSGHACRYCLINQKECILAKGNWLTLMEYSNRHRVSISTLRRRIKANEMTFQFADGKYFLLEDSLPTQRQASGPENIVPPQSSVTQDQEPKVSSPPSSNGSTAPSPSLCQTADSLLQEVKRAYSMVLQEKEELILQLREEVSDLQTLVRVLENEVQRLQAEASNRKERPSPVAPSSLQTDSFDLELDQF